MNRQQRRAAGAQRQRWQGTSESKRRLAEAVHEAVASERPGREHMACALYAHATQAVLGALGVEAEFQAGSATIWTGHEDLCVGYDTSLAAQEGREGLEFHAWLVIPQAAPIIIDTATRHFELLARQRGLEWRRGPLPFLWDEHRRLHGRLDTYGPDYDTTMRVRGTIDSDEVLRVSRLTLQRMSEGART